MLAPVALLLAAAPAAAQSNSTEALGIEWSGGTIGSVVGLGVGLLLVHPGRCPGEDVGCVLERLGLIALTTAVTAPLGAWSAGEFAGTDPSATGAAIAGLVGAAAGVGALRALSELGMEPRGVAAVVVYTVTQGLVTGAGSRIGAAVGDD